MIKAIIFDCFGVLVTDGLEALIIDQNLTLEDTEKVIGLVVSVNKGLLDYETYKIAISSVFGIAPEEYAEKIKNMEIINHPLLDQIKELRKSYKIGMLSNVSSQQSLLARFDGINLSDCFDAIVASGQIGYAKPEAQAYEITASQLGAKLDECVMVDDREDYVQGAIGVGMSAVHYRTYEQMKVDLQAVLK